jgi:4'-phosphopantetheinyl transferase
VIAFEKPPETLSLSKEEVHIWWVAFSDFSKASSFVFSSLSQSEKDRAVGFADQKKRDYFLLSRFILRDILSRYIREDSKSLDFYLGEHGKPYLKAENLSINIQFSMSHTENVAVYAVTIDQDIGVDVEYVGRTVNVEKIAKRFFSDGEYQKLLVLSGNQQKDGFLRCWVCKEAYLKAVGTGLSDLLASVEIDFACDEGNQLLSLGGDKELVGSWFAQAFCTEEDFIVGLAASHGVNQFRCYRWRESSHSLAKG